MSRTRRLEGPRPRSSGITPISCASSRPASHAGRRRLAATQATRRGLPPNPSHHHRGRSRQRRPRRRRCHMSHNHRPLVLHTTTTRQSAAHWLRLLPSPTTDSPRRPMTSGSSLSTSTAQFLPHKNTAQAITLAGSRLPRYRPPLHRRNSWRRPPPRLLFLVAALPNYRRSQDYRIFTQTATLAAITWTSTYIRPYPTSWTRSHSSRRSLG